MKKMVAWMLCAAAPLLLLAGCGGSSGGSSSSASSSAASTSSTASAAGTTSAAGGSTGAPVAGGANTVKIFVESTVNAPTGSYPGTFGAAQAAADQINASGAAGHGRKLQIITCNAQFDPNDTASCARQAVADKAAAYIGFLPFATASAPILARAGIPETGWVYNQTTAAIPTVLPVNGVGAGAEFAGLPAAARLGGAKKIGIVSLDIPGEDTNIDGEKRAAAKLGLKVVTSIKVPATSTQMNSAMFELRSAGADTVFMNISAAQQQAFVVAANSAGWHPIYATAMGEHNAQTLAAVSKLADKLYSASAVPVQTAPGQSSIPAVNQFRAAMTAAAKAGDSDASSDLSSASFFTWATTQALAQVMKTIHGQVDAKSLSAALKSAKDVNVVGLWKWTPSSMSGGTLYPHQTDGGLTYIGPVKDGYFQPSQQRVPVITQAGMG